MGRKDIWGTSDLQSREAEDIRRRFDDVPAPEKPEDFGGGGGLGGQPIIPPPPPPTKATPDREHFWGNHFVLVSNDHRQGEDNPIAPGYAPSGQASSLQAGYDKAVELVSKLANGGRVVIILKGGYYKESVNFNNPRIDLEGEGSPMVIGNSRVDPLATKMKIRNITWISETDDVAAIKIMPTPWLPPFLQYPPEIEIFDCEFIGTNKAFEASRRFYAFGSIMKVTSDVDLTSEIGACHINAWAEPVGPAILDACYFYSKEHEIYGFAGVAIFATAKVQSFTTFNGGYAVGSGSDIPDTLYLDKSGVVLKDCHVCGGLINEGWNVAHIGGWQKDGFIAIDTGNVYAKMRGWRIFGNDGAEKAVNALTYWNNTATYSSIVGYFIPDQEAPESYAVGGMAWYLNSLHKNRMGAFGQRPFVNQGSTGTVHAGTSMTGGDFWGGPGVTTNVVSSPTSTDATPAIMLPMMSDILMH